MPVLYKKDFDILERLKEAGYTTYRLRVEHLLSESSIQAIREGRMVSIDVIGKLCSLLNCQIEDLIEYVPEGARPFFYELPTDGFGTMMVAEPSDLDSIFGKKSDT